jgi:hypothetical protein
MPGSNRGPLVACAAYAGGCRVADVAIEDIFGEAVSRDTTMRIYTLKRDLLEIKRGVSPLVDICNRLMRPRDPAEREGGRAARAARHR